MVIVAALPMGLMLASPTRAWRGRSRRGKWSNTPAVEGLVPYFFQDAQIRISLTLPNTHFFVDEYTRNRNEKSRVGFMDCITKKK